MPWKVSALVEHGKRAEDTLNLPSSFTENMVLYVFIKDHVVGKDRVKFWYSSNQSNRSQCSIKWVEPAHGTEHKEDQLDAPVEEKEPYDFSNWPAMSGRWGSRNKPTKF